MSWIDELGARLKRIADLNGDGVVNAADGAIALGALKTAARLVVFFVPSHTIAAKVAKTTLEASTVLEGEGTR